ncbi:MAG TPA: OmpA family protein [Verrucomicrobiae bacterium]
MMTKLVYTTSIALALAIASTGCVHRPYGVTAIPPLPNPNVADQNPNTIPSAPAVYSTPQPISTPAIAENGPFDPSKWDQDPHALAANTVHFGFDSAVIRDSETAKLQAVAAALNSDKTANLMIEGNCDERGTEEYNRSLGERRAEAAREALVGMGVDENRIHTTSFGKDKPVATGHSDAVWSKNRRDDFVVLHPKTGA